MDIGDLDIPPALADHFGARGIESLYPPQRSAVEAGVLDGESVVAAVPTASGKTLIAELAMVTSPGKALYIVPLRALATEKYEAFAGLPDVDVGIATGDYDTTADDLGGADVIVATSEKVDSLIRNDASWLTDLACVVVDEVHLLDSTARGPTLEVTIAKLRELVPDLQVVALSATVANPSAIAEWVDATLVETDWRPVDLRRGVYADGTIAFEDGRERAVSAGTGDPTHALIRDVLGSDGQCLVFVHSRRAAEDLADRFATEWTGAAGGAARDIADAAQTDIGRRLAACVRDGVAFHHAGLRTAHRVRVERAFRARDLDVICATPTLAAGVNIPARRVIVRDYRRYTDRGREPLPVLEVHQMFGRAGRPHLDPYGEAVLVAESAAEARELTDRYLDGEPEAVASKLASQDALRTHVLSTIASGFADSRRTLLDVLAGTFYASQEGSHGLADVADLVLDYLVSVDMIRVGDDLVATELGEHVSRLYVDPRSAAVMIEELRRASRLPECSTLTVLEIVADTAELSTFYLRSEDWAVMQRFAERNEPVFTTSLDDFDGAYDEWLSTLKTVRVIAEWIDGASEEDLTDRYGIGPGDLRSTVERAEWLLSAADSLAGHCGLDVQPAVREAREGLDARGEGDA